MPQGERIKRGGEGRQRGDERSERKSDREKERETKYTRIEGEKMRCQGGTEKLKEWTRETKNIQG